MRPHRKHLLETVPAVQLRFPLHFRHSVQPEARINSKSASANSGKGALRTHIKPTCHVMKAKAEDTEMPDTISLPHFHIMLLNMLLGTIRPCFSLLIFN